MFTYEFQKLSFSYLGLCRISLIRLLEANQKSFSNEYTHIPSQPWTYPRQSDTLSAPPQAESSLNITLQQSFLSIIIKYFAFILLFRLLL